MTLQEIQDLAGHRDVPPWVVKLVGDALDKLREEIVYTWIPPHFVDLAVKEERESCAERAWIALVKHKQPWNVRQDVTEAIKGGQA